MKQKVIIVTAIVVLAAFNFFIYQKENIKRNGESIYLELAPADPRSLMQGDYMAFRFALTNNVKPTDGKTQGDIVVTLDDKKIARFKRFYHGETLSSAERKLHYRYQHGAVTIVPNTFLFQEGEAYRYQQAKYGIYKIDAKGRYILYALADDKLQVIEIKKR